MIARAAEVSDKQNRQQQNHFMCDSCPLGVSCEDELFVTIVESSPASNVIQ